MWRAMGTILIGCFGGFECEEQLLVDFFLFAHNQFVDSINVNTNIVFIQSFNI